MMKKFFLLSLGSFVITLISSFNTGPDAVVQKPSIKTIIKIGGTNIAGKDYRTNLGGPFVGQQYYISLTFDEFLN